MSSPIHEMLSELRKEGHETRRGGFTLDREKAREKMSAFSLADPRCYVLELVQAAVLMQGEAVRREVAIAGDRRGLLAADASPIRFDIDSDGMHLRFGGEPFTVEDFDLIYASLFSGGDDRRSRARRQLALGLNAALALNPRFVRVVSGDKNGSAVLEMRPGKPDHYEAREAPAEGTHVHVKSRFRPGLVVQFYRNVAGTIAEEVLLRDACKGSWYPVDLEGQQLAEGLDLPEVSEPFTIPGDGDVVGLCGFEPGSVSPGTVHLYKDGVRITSHERAELPRGLVAAVDAESLRKDVSQSNIVENDAYLEVIERVRRAARTLLAVLGQKLVKSWEGSGSTPHASWSWERLLSFMRSQQTPLTERTPASDDLEHVLLRIPFWVSIDGRWWSVEKLLAECEGGELGWTEKSYVEDIDALDQYLHSDAPLVLQLPEEVDVDVVRRMFGARLTQQTEALDRVLKREENRRLWRSRVAKPNLREVVGKQRYFAVNRVKSDGVRCQVGLTIGAGDADDASFDVYCIVDGHLLVKRSIDRVFDGVMGGVVAVVEGDLTPDDMYSSVVPDDGLAAALGAVLRALHGAFDRLATDWLNARRPDPDGGSDARSKLRARLLPEEDGLRVRMLDYLDLVYGEDFPESFFGTFGIARDGLFAEPRDDADLWRPRLTAVPDEADPEAPPYDRLPLFATVKGDWLSLMALRHWMQQHGELRWVPDARSQDPDCDVPILWLPDPARRVLEAVFGADRLREDVAGYRLARHEAIHLRKKTVPIELQEHTAGLFVVHFRVGDTTSGMEGELGLWNRVLEPMGSWELRLLRNRRPLVTLRATMCLPAGKAVINFDGIVPTADWENVQAGEGWYDVLLGLRRAAQQLLVHLATHLDGMPDHSRKNARELIRNAVRAWFPPRLAEIFGTLRNRMGSVEEAVALYEELLRPLASVEPDALATLLTAALTDPDELPEPPLVFSQIPQDAWPLGLAEAPLSLSFNRCDERWEIPVTGGEVSTVVVSENEQTLRTLLQTPIFEAGDGSYASAWDLLARSAAGETIHYVHSFGSEEDQMHPGVMVVSGTELDLVRSIVGEAHVRHGGALIQEASQRKHFLAREVVEALVLAPGEALVWLPLDEDGIRGQVGLAPDPEAGSWIDLHKERRHVCRNASFTVPGLVATINDDRLTVKRDYTYVERNDRLKQIYGCCEALRGPLYLLLAEQWDGLDAGVRQAHAPSLLVHFAEGVGGSYAEGVSIEDALLSRLAELRLLEDVVGAWHSLDDLGRVCAQTGHVDYLREAREGELADPHQVVLLANRQITSPLKRIFGTLRDYAPMWDDDQVLVALRRHGAPALPAEDPSAGLVRTQFRLSPWDGYMYLPQDPSTELLVHFGLQGTEAIAWQPSRVFPCAGRFDTDKLRVYRRRQRGTITDAQERILERQACSLYQTLASRYRSGDQPEGAREAARVYLRHAVHRLHLLVRADPEEQLNRYWRNLHKRLEGQPLFPLANGEWVSLQTVLELRPPELEAYGLWGDSQPEASAGLRIGRARVIPCGQGAESEGAGESPTVAESPDVAAPPSPRDKERRLLMQELEEATLALSSTLEDFPTEGLEDVVAVQDTEQVETQSAEERLVDGLRAELEALHTEENPLLDDVMMLSMRLSRDPSDRAASCDESGVTLYRAHPVVEALLDEDQDAPVLLSMLAMGVYTAVNLYLEEITDDHEAQFQHLLVQRVRDQLFEEVG